MVMRHTEVHNSISTTSHPLGKYSSFDDDAAILCRSLGRVGGVDEEILIRCGADMMGSGRHGVNIFCVLCV